MCDAFTEFEHEGWERVANQYDSTWSTSTRQFIPPLLDAAEVFSEMSILDVGCGPGYVSAAHADINVDLPAGPPHHLYSGRDEFRQALERAGFDGSSMIFKLHAIEWNVPTARFAFEAERRAGVRTAGLLARQSPEKLRAIQSAIEAAVARCCTGDGFAIPKAAYIVAIAK